MRSVVVCLLVLAGGCSQVHSHPLITARPPDVPRCATSALTATLAEPGAAAGTTYETLTLTSHDAHPCFVYGYAGVSLVDANGAQIGKPADRNAVTAPARITLRAGSSAYALVGFPNPGNFPAGQCSGGTHDMRVYPPDETASLLVPTTHEYCPGFSVGAFSTSRP